MNSRAQVLIVGRDVVLQKTREWILGAHFQVDSAATGTEAEAMLDQHAFDLIILCHSLEDDECCRLAAKAQHQHPP